MSLFCYFPLSTRAQIDWHSALFSLQAAGRQLSLMRSPQPELPMQWPQPVAKATSASAAVTARSRATTTTRRRAGSGEAARPMWSTGWSSRGALSTPGRSRKTPGGWWTCTTTRQGERYHTPYITLYTENWDGLSMILKSKYKCSSVTEMQNLADTKWNCAIALQSILLQVSLSSSLGGSTKD